MASQYFLYRRRLTGRWSLLLCLIGLLVVLPARAATLALDADTALVLTPDQVVFQWEDEPLQREQLLSPARASHWQPVQKKALHFGATGQAVWLRFEVQSQVDTPQRWLVAIPWTMLNHIELSLHHADGRWSDIQRSGYDVAFRERFGEYRQYTLPIDLQPGERATVLMRVQTKYIAFVPLTLWSTSRFDQHDQQDTLGYGLAYGVLLAMLVYNLILYLFVRDRSYFYYVLYVLSIILYEAALTGFGERYLWRDLYRFQAHAYPLFAQLGFIFAALFIRQFLSLRSVRGWPLHTNTFFIGYWLLALGVYLVTGPETLKKVNDPMALASCVAALATSIHLWRKGSVPARYFALAWGQLIVATMGTVLMTQGAVPYDPLLERAQMVGFVLEMLLLSIALADRINRERAQREATQQLALEMARQVNEERRATLEAQGHALALQQRHTDELELRVLDRTAELERTLRNLELANRELARLSVTDPLTGLHNRRYFDEVLTSEIQRCQRFSQSLSLVLVDVDHFKRINDTYGHLIGDECLRLLASTLRQEVSRATDLVARYGGEEFAVVLPGTSDTEAAVVADRIRQAIEKIQFIHAGKRIPLSASLGVAGRVPLLHETSARLIAAADEALYQAKESGRNRVMVAALAQG